jgi:hypothetical protein
MKLKVTQLRKLIREAFGSDLQRFYFHPNGKDIGIGSNYQGAPPGDDPGWQVIEAASYMDAIDQLPEAEHADAMQALIANGGTEDDVEAGMSVEDWLANEQPGCKLPWILYGEDDYDSTFDD